VGRDEDVNRQITETSGDDGVLPRGNASRHRAPDGGCRTHCR
jgi:hypothetical protein